MSRGFWECLKRERDNHIKHKLSGGKTGFRYTPALSGHLPFPRGCPLANVIGVLLCYICPIIVADCVEGTS